MLELSHVSAEYFGKTALREVSLTFQPGQVLAIVGPNGGGKSTLLKTAIGLLPPTTGTIILDGSPLKALNAKQIAQKVSYLPQSRSVPDITARRMVMHGRFPHMSYPRRYTDADRQIVIEALKQADALELADRSVKTLSGGQRQKIYLAMALAQQTGTILMDEPTTYLDIAHQLQVIALARKLAAQGKAVVLVLHDLPMALAGADRLAVLHKGALAALGTPEEIYASGIIPKAFGVALCRMQTENGWQYYCCPQ